MAEEEQTGSMLTTGCPSTSFVKIDTFFSKKPLKFVKLDFLLSKKFALFSQNVNKLSRILRDVFAKYLSKTGWERHPVFSWGSFNCLQHCAALHFRNFFSSLKTSSLQYSISHHRKIKIVWRDTR